ncbi:MAG: hypothetical protein PHX87_00895 [Candidatus Peribacteraceae bacterium]|nr:hypothetical protein [Candidatus Peribacteraceae bacterium]MDD5741966.1 hypothetical protein [Candidatus Peribacteraceae bacterium]
MPHRSGFSLIAFIVLIACSAIAAVIIFILANPAQLIRARRNARRMADVTLILQAVQSYRSANGNLPADIDAEEGSVQIIGNRPANCPEITCPGHVLPSTNCIVKDLDASLRPALQKIPTDPKTGTEGDTRYFINQDADGVLTVGACDAEKEDWNSQNPAPTVEAVQKHD